MHDDALTHYMSTSATLRTRAEKAEAERDVATVAADAAAEAIGTMAAKLSELMAERNHFQAVVGAAHELLDEDRTSWSDEHARLAEALAALDSMPAGEPMPAIFVAYEDLLAERDRLQGVIDTYRDEMAHIALAVVTGPAVVHEDDILALVRSVVAERDRLRTALSGMADVVMAEAFHPNALLPDDGRPLIHGAYVLELIGRALDESGSGG